MKTHRLRRTKIPNLSLLLLLMAAPACNIDQNGNRPIQKFNFAVIVRDRDNNNSVGQATVLLAAGNETLAREVTDDNGQANFTIDTSYYGKSARIYAKSPYYHPAELEISLTTESRKIIQLISKKNPKIDPDPVEPAPPGNSKPTSTSPPRKPALEIVRAGESKTGMIADKQVIDFQFDADENVPLLFSGRAIGEHYIEFQIEIYDSQGFPQKGTGVSRNNPVQMPFTPPKTGSYILRLRGTLEFGTYLVYMQELQ